MLNSWEDVKGVVYYQGLSYVPKVIRTELISRYHDEGILASIQLKNLLPGNPSETYSYRYRLEGHKLQLGRDCLCLPIKRIQTTIQSLLSSTSFKRCYATSRCRYQLMHLVFPDPIVSNLDSILTSKSWSLRYYFWAQLRLPPTRTKISKQAIYGNPSPTDLWGYVHGFGHLPEDLVAPLIHWVSLKLWQISLGRTLWGFKHIFGHKKPRSYTATNIICDVFHVSLLEHDHYEGAGVRERYKMYKIYEEDIRKYRTNGKYPTPYPNQSLFWYLRPTMASPCSAEALPVTSNGLHLWWPDLWQSQLFRPLSHSCSWRARTSGCQQYNWPE